MSDKVTIIWDMTAKTAMEFYERCIARGANTEEERTKILMELADEGKMTRVVATSRTKDQVLRDTAKNFNILKIPPEGD